MALTEINNISLCKHCHEVVQTPFRDEDENTFCCQGCLSVHSILKAGNLEKFYQIQKQTGEYTKPVTHIEDTHYDYLNQQSFIDEYGRFKNDQWSMSFYLKGVHCLACLWLIEKLPELVSSVEKARLNLGKSLVTVTLKNGSQEFKKAAETLNKLGYTPFPISNQDELEKAKLKEERSLLLKIGIAGFSMMNIMLYTGSVYAGADGGYFISFGLLSLLLSIPVILYSALPFYKSAWSAIQAKQINIDVPLSLAIISGFIISTYFLALGREHFYYDSIATLTFLILLSRFVLRKVQQTSLNKNDLVGIFQRGNARRKTEEGSYENVLPSQLKTDDIIKVEPNQVFPCDGEIIEGKTRINLSTLTGESENILHSKGSKVFMGTLNISYPIEVKVEKVGFETRMGSLLEELENSSKLKSQYSYITDRVSKRFVQAVLLLSILTLTVTTYFLGFETALENSLALIIVTCPCALGLATPLTFGRIMTLGQKQGIIIKSEEVLERLVHIKNIIFDKTGTLTKGNFVVSSYELLSSDAFAHFTPQELAFSLESKSSHPVAKAIVSWAKSSKNYLNALPLDQYEEILGKGIQAYIDGDFYEVYSIEAESKDTQVLFTKNEQRILLLTLKDELKPEAPAVIRNLNNHGFETYLFSGDKKSIVSTISEKLSLKPTHVVSQMSPEDKAREVSKLSQTLFIGDGANDSLAFSKADASVATHGSVEVSLRVADIFLTQPNLHHISELLFLAKKAVKTVKLNLGFSLAYNLTGAALAIFGLIGPLEAAVLMPVSSLTVLGITLYNTRDSVIREKNGDS